MRYLIIAIALLLSAAIPAQAQIGVGFRSHDVSISFHVSAYPRLVAIPGYPVYYDPRANSNYFFYDGLYWVFEDDNWYSSAWYDGPWDLVDPEYVPLFVLRVPVRYYRHRPAYFSGWSLNFAPRWGEHWGHDWEQHRSGWDRWDRHSVPRAAPLPSYQARYSGSRYPRAAEQQYSIQSRSYRYQPREQITRQYFQQRAATTGAPAVAPQQVQPQRQTRVRDQAHAQPQQQPRPAPRTQTEQPSRVRDQAQPQQQPRPTPQAQTEQRSRTRSSEQAQAQQQTRASQQAQAQQRTRSNEQAHAQQQARASQQAQAQQQTRVREQPQARQPQQQQQQQPSRERAQVQPRGQQQQAAPKAKGPSSQQQQQQQKKEKEDKKDGSGGQGGQ